MTPEQRMAAIDALRMLPDKQRALIMEAARRRAVRDELTAADSVKQTEMEAAIDAGTFTSICAGRRAGKTWKVARKLAKSMEEAAKNEWCIYMAQTGGDAKDLLWPDLVEVNETHRLGWKMLESPIPNITSRSGARLKLIGCDDKAEIGKLRGKKYKLVVIDEAQSQRSEILRELVYEVLRPAFVQVGGKIAITGTPGKIMDHSDFWYSICHGARGWRHVTDWTIYQNPWVTNPDKELAMVREEMDWTEDNVIYQREYLGRWVSSAEERVYPYVPERNSREGLPQHYNRETWYHVMGVDYGFSPDPCAWVVLASHPHESDVYVVHAESHAGMTSDAAAQRTAELVSMYRPSSVVGDSGGLGKPYVEDFNRRHGARLNTYIKPANKQGKRDHIEVMGQEMIAPGSVAGKGRVIACLPMAAALTHEWSNLGWKDDHRMVENPGAANHLSDAALYGHVEMRSYWHKRPKPPLTGDEAERAAMEARKRAARMASRTSVLWRR